MQIPDDASLVTCSYCNAQLSIQRNDSVVYAKTLGRIEAHTQQLLDRVGSLEIQNELLQLEQEWAQEQKTYMTTNPRTGTTSEPSAAMSVLAGVLMIGMSIFFAPLLFSKKGAAELGVLALFLIGGGLFIIIHGVSKANKYQAALARYEQRRYELLHKQAQQSKKAFRAEDSPATTF